MCITLSYRNYSEPHSQNRICDASFLLIEASSPKKFPKLCSFMQAWFANLCKFPRLWIVTKKTAHTTSPHWDEFISAVPPKFLMWKMKIIFTFTIRLLTHVTSEETSYPTKSMLSALEFFRYAARVGISILLEPQEAFQPVGFPLCQENRILLCTFIAFTLIW